MAVAVGAKDMKQANRSFGLLRLRVLRQFRADCGGEVVPDSAWERPTARTLVKLLAVQPGHRLHQDQIIDLLWPELNPDAALGSLRKATTFARHALEPDRRRGESSYLQVAGGLIALNPDTVWIDADEFQNRADVALSGADETLYRDALSHYAGELLPGDRYEEWTLEPRNHLDDLHQRLLLGLADLLECRQAFDEALKCLHEVLQADDAREDIHRRLMRLYVASGNRNRAMRQYHHCETTLRNELGVAPEPETTALHEEIASGRFQPAPAASRARTSVPLASPLPAVVRRIERGPLVGRELPMNLLRAELRQLELGDDVGIGRRGVVLIGGEAGVGKTRLAVEAALLAHSQDVLVMWGSSYEEEGRSPYAPFVEALEGYLAGHTDDERREVAASYRELARLVPSLSAQFAHETQSRWTPDAVEGGQLRLFSEVVRFLAGVSETQAILLVLDDLHAADSASLQLLHHLARVASENRWLILGTYREEEVTAGTQLELLRSSLTRSSLCRHVDLLRLSRSDCAALIASRLPGGTPHPKLIDRVHALSLGNALFAQELVERMRDQGLVLRDGVWEDSSADVEVPARVRDVIAVRLGRLPDEVQTVLALAAVGGMESEYAVLRRAAEMEDVALLDACDRALEARVIEERGSLLAFRHPLFRQAMYDRLSRHRRRHLHAGLAEAYMGIWTDRRSDEYVESIAYHFREADASEAAEWQERAGDRAANIHAADAAIEYYEEARRRLPEFASPGVARLNEKVGAVLLSVGRYDRALMALEEAATALEKSGDIEAAGSVIAKIGLAHRWQGTPEEGISRVRPAIERLERRGASRALASLYVTLAHLLLLTGRYREMLDATERAAALARQTEDMALLGQSEERRGAALLLLNRPAEGQRVIESAIPLIESSMSDMESSGSLDVLRSALHNAGCAAAYLGQVEKQAYFAERALGVAERIGNPGQIGFILGNLGHALLLTGEWDAARRHLDRAVRMAREGERSVNLTFPLTIRGLLAFREGDLKPARELLDESLRVAVETDNRQGREEAERALAEMYLRSDGAAEALALLQRQASEEDVDVTVLPMLTWALLETGDLRRAEETAGHGVTRARAEEPLSLPDALRVQGMVFVRIGRTNEARGAFEESLSAARRLPYPFGEAETLLELGALMVRCGDAADGRSRLQEARTIFQRLGARRDVERADRALSLLVRA